MERSSPPGNIPRLCQKPIHPFFSLLTQDQFCNCRHVFPIQQNLPRFHPYIGQLFRHTKIHSNHRTTNSEITNLADNPIASNEATSPIHLEVIMSLIQPVNGLLRSRQPMSLLASRAWDLLATKTLFAACLLLANFFASTQVLAIDPVPGHENLAETVAKIPFSELNQDARAKINSVLDKPSFSRRLPTESIPCDHDLFLFLVRHPEVLVNIWDVMQITRVELLRVADFEFRGNDGAGTTCQSELIYGTPNLHIYYGTGIYSGSLAARNVSGKCLCVLRSVTGKDAAGNPTIGSQMDIYMKLDSLGADLVTRTLAPVVGKTADSNFRETAHFISQLSRVCETNPTAIQDMAQRLTKVQPEIRQKFSECAMQVAMRAAGGGQQPQPIKPAEESDLLEANKDPFRGLEAKPRIPEKPELIMKR